MKQYPMLFQVTGRSHSGIQSSWAASTADQAHSLELAIPPEFDGPGGGFSPEDLYALALQNCFIATFKVFAEKSKLSYHEIKVQTKLEVDRNEKGMPWMARIYLKINLLGVQQHDNAKRILEKTSQSCMILNSVNTVKTFEYEINP